MNMKASDLSARLLATENLSVVRARTRTASFDIKSRVLTLPMWKEMTPEVEDMLIGHEVGHALYTGEKYMEPIRENRKMMSYLNVLEDVRIEKLIKRKYPGLRKKMNEGYKQLNDRDFFGVKQVPSFDALLLIDKINLYFKAGFQCGVTFSPDEKAFVNRAERTETVEDVIDLAKDVWTYSKEKLDEQKKNAKAEANADGEEEDPLEGDFDPDLDGDWDEEEDQDADDMDAIVTDRLDNHRVGKLRGAVALGDMGRNNQVAGDVAQQSLVRDSRHTHHARQVVDGTGRARLEERYALLVSRRPAVVRREP
jgi:hypothetical protein